MLAEIFQRLDSGLYLEAEALTVQCLKACHQTFLDEGDWRTGWLLTTLPDPLARTRFGGSEKELEAVASYTKALDSVEQTVRRERNKEKDEEAPDGGGKGRAKGKADKDK